MILAIDAGNSREVGLARPQGWTSIATVSLIEFAASSDQVNPFSVTHADPERIIISNVAGEGAHQLLVNWTSIFDAEPVWLRAEAERCGVRNLYERPEQLGPDRWAAMIAARALHPAGAALVVNAGTATTVDMLSADGGFSAAPSCRASSSCVSFCTSTPGVCRSTKVNTATPRARRATRLKAAAVTHRPAPSSACIACCATSSSTRLHRRRRRGPRARRPAVHAAALFRESGPRGLGAHRGERARRCEMRVLFLVLVLANLALFGWWRYGASTDAGDPAPLARQIEPEKLRLISPAELRSASAREPAVACLEWAASRRRTPRARSRRSRR